MNEKKTEKRLEFSEEKVTKIVEEILEIYSKHHPGVAEIIVATSNIVYALGASIGEYEGTGPTIDELKKIYYSNPNRVDAAFMLQALLMSTWYNDWVRHQIQQDNSSYSGDNND